MTGTTHTNKNITITILVILLLTLSLTQGCISYDRQVNELKIFHAGSLSGPFFDLEKEFERISGTINVQREVAGSADVIRKVTELGKVADVLASADYTLIESMMIKNDPQFATWYIQFAVNKLVIAYTEHSTAHKEINIDNWPDIFLRDDVNIGFSNPNTDPCGYRSLMMLQLAEDYYKLPNLFDNLIENHCSVSVIRDDDNITINAPEYLNPDSTLMIRPKEIDLMVQLEAGELDYLIIYRSVAYQHRNAGIKYLDLPDAIDLSNADLAAEYGKISLQQFSNQPKKGKLIQAKPIVYGITIPINAANTKEAEEFIKLLLGENGREIFNNNGQPPIIPPRTNNISALPVDLQELFYQNE